MNEYLRKRVVIENVSPQVEEGLYPIKRTEGERVHVEGDVFSDGHEIVTAVLLYRRSEEETSREVTMNPLGNDRFGACFLVENTGTYFYTVKGWVNKYRSLCEDIKKKWDAGQDTGADIKYVVELLKEARKRASEEDAKLLEKWITTLEKEKESSKPFILLNGEELKSLMDRYPDEHLITTYHKELKVDVERKKALFSSWYELFPRSSAFEPGKHGTLSDVKALLPEIAEMGFDIIYLPPIHPIGKTNRKGKNNSPEAKEGDPGSPWAIGSEEGGHKAVHPELGTINDLKNLVKSAEDYGLEVALDLTFQCSPDHPYVKEHPEWFRWRPDGTVQYAENPPKKYEDVIPLNFDTENWGVLWKELKSIILFWIDKGINIFRVDNPHTKPFAFWEWIIREVKKEHPQVIFLSEAFTRPKVMYRLAKIGFSQSYTYFTWRNTKREIEEYINELTKTEVREFFRPNFWPNTPDILPEYLQYGGKPAFIIKLVLAATLSSSYGIYGPAFELCVSEAIPGKEEYMNSEKYEIRYWDRRKSGNIRDFISRINKIRKENSSLQDTYNLRFCRAENDFIIFYLKIDSDLSSIILVAVNLDPYNVQSARVQVPIWDLGIPSDQPYLLHDLLSDEKHIWQGEYGYVSLNPWVMPAAIYRLKRFVKRESDFDYFI